MEVSLMGQGLGAAHAVPRPGSGHQGSARGGTEPRALAGTATRPPAAAGSPASRALFDANGDGVIENWSYVHGGDSLVTFTPAPTGSNGTHLRRSNDALPGRHGRSTDPNLPHAETVAAVHHAHDAYQRDGLAIPAGSSSSSPSPVSSSSAPAGPSASFALPESSGVGLAANLSGPAPGMTPTPTSPSGTTPLTVSVA